MKVTKRNGIKVDFDVSKIKQSVEQACEDLEVSALALESKFDEFLVDGISTRQIQQNLIQHAKAMATPEEPDWVFVAGRLETMDLWADTRSYDISFLEFVKEQKTLGIWKHEAFDKYSDEEITELGNCIVKERDLNHSIASVLTASQKYLLPNECIQHMFMGNAMVIASVEAEDNRLTFAKIVYEALSERKISLATPWLSNLRSGGNISSCFIMAVGDDIESIFDRLKDAALISKNGGGLGVSLSSIRARGSDLMGQSGASGGTFGWMKLFNDTAVSVNQGGKRKGAFTLQLPIWHADVDEFLDIQTEHGDLRKKAYDIKPQLTVPDLFMELKNDSSRAWHTFCPHEVNSKLGIKLFECFGEEFEAAYNVCVAAHESGKLKVVRTWNAKELWKKVMRVQFETGMPYIAYIDEINRQNPNKHIGYIPCVNLCVESFSVVEVDGLQHTCNLASLVLGRIEVDEIEHYAAITTRILDNGIALTNPPTKGSDKHNNMLRTIGVGQQGYCDLVAREFVNYTDADFAAKISEAIQIGCVREGIKLAQERGAYPAFEGSEWQSGERVKRFENHSTSRKEVWQALQVDIDKWGIRNSQFTSPAPNTSSSIFMDAGAGIGPIYSAFFYEDNATGLIPVSAMHLKLNPISYAKSVGKFKPWELTPVVGAMQKFVDTGISAEYIMDKNQQGFNAKWLWDTLESAWRNKTKAVYYIRTIKAGESIVKNEADCVGCSG